MKTAIYIENGVAQLVLTPESEFEKSAIRPFTDQPVSASVARGSFYACRGGYVRQSSDDMILVLALDAQTGGEKV